MDIIPKNANEFSKRKIPQPHELVHYKPFLKRGAPMHFSNEMHLSGFNPAFPQ